MPNPHNIKKLAGDLGISDKQLAKLARKHGDALENVLSKWWNETREKPRFMARQAGVVLGDPYVENPAFAMDDLEAVPKDYQVDVITKQANVTWTLYVNAERAQEVADQQGKQLVRKLRKLQADAARQGVDITPRLVAMIQEAEAELAEHREAA